MSNINQISPDGGTTLYDIEDTDARSDISSLQSTKANVSDLGTSAYKNSTSVVTDSSDLVESGAVKDIVGWGNKNIGVWNNVALSGDVTMGYKLIANGSSLIAPIKNNTNYTVSKKSTSYGNRFRIILFKNEPSFTITLEVSIIVNNSSELTEYTFNSGVYNYVVFTYESSDVITQDTAEAMIELGSVKTAYEPYHASVDATKCDNSVIGTVEDGATASQSYAVGEHFIRDGAFCTVTQAISSGGTLTENTNYTSGDVASELAIKGYLGGSDNLNSITTDGIYGFGSNPTNAPNTSIIHGMLIVKHSYSTILTQIIIHDTEGIFVRRYTNSWQPWIKYSPIKSATFSGTTNASGNFSITTDLTRVVLGIELDNDQTALKYKTSNYIGIHIMNASSLEAYASQPVSGTYYYI